MNQLTPELLAQLYYQNSHDPFLTLLTLRHENFEDIRLVNNTVNINSRGMTYLAYPFKIAFPADDGETMREVTLEMDNTTLELIDEIRSSVTPITVIIEMILASRPNEVQIGLEELKIGNVSYNKSTITARLYLDNFLNMAMNAEKYTPTIYPGLF